jgi:hypothetical protein
MPNGALDQIRALLTANNFDIFLTPAEAEGRS